MDQEDSEEVSGALSRPPAFMETGPYVFHSLLDDLPLSADGDRDDIEINCVEFLGTYDTFH